MEIALGLSVQDLLWSALVADIPASGFRLFLWLDWPFGCLQLK
jgi:hypothetical protein